MEPYLYFAALLVGWWLPAVIYYLGGLFFADGLRTHARVRGAM
jgi:hypothetical protein